MKTIDMKMIAIAVLAVALIIVSVLYMNEKNKPDSLQAFSQELGMKQQNMKTQCADVKTDETREKCVKALEEVKELLTTVNSK